MGDQTEEPESSAPHNSHANAELSTGTRSAESAIPRPARAPKREFPELASYQGRGRYPAHEKDRVDLPALEGLEPSGSAGSILSKATLLRLPESLKLTNP